MGKVKPKKNWSHRYWQDNEECIQDNQPAIDVSDHRHVAIRALYDVREIGFTTSKDVENGSTASSEFISQQVPLKPYSAYNMGQDLNQSDIIVPPFMHECSCINLTMPNNGIVDHSSTVYPNAIDIMPWCKGHTAMAGNDMHTIYYVTNHLSELDKIQDYKCQYGKNTNSKQFKCNEKHTSQTPLSTPPKITDNKLHQPTNKNNSNICNDASAVTIKRRFRKAIIPEEVKDLLRSAGLDEQTSAKVIVDCNIDNFRKNCAKIADLPEIKTKLMELRRKGKNRNAAKKSRQNMLKRMNNIRRTHQRLSDTVRKKKSVVAKIKILQERYRKQLNHYKEHCKNWGDERSESINRIDVDHCVEILHIGSTNKQNIKQ